jgi:hypothetical protein
MSTIPFSYHLFHNPTNQHYYGIKYAKGCNPTDLWTTYFSSSDKVKQLITEYGVDSFVATVRRTFSTASEALAWECRVLQRLNVRDRTDWLNRHNGGTKFRSPIEHSPETKEILRRKITGKKRSENTKKKQSVSAISRESQRRATGWEMPAEAMVRMSTTRKERIAAGLIDPYSKEQGRKISESKKGTKRHYLPDGSFKMIKP